jgi:DNA-binding protein HU-beta
MNKGDLVDKVAAKATVTKKQADAVLTAVLEVVMEAVANDDKVTLVGFGSFEARERKAREGRNPKTGEKPECQLFLLGSNSKKWLLPLRSNYSDKKIQGKGQNHDR